VLFYNQKTTIKKGGMNMTQGERVNQIRKTLDLTLEKFGEKLGVQKSSISKIEKDRVALSDQMAKSICREYNVNYDYLMYGEGEMFDDLPQTIVDELCAQYDLNDFDKALVEMYVSLPAGNRERIKEYMKQLVKKVGWDKTE
jgi:transcriptional regulator with XRE-family HTH domain